MEKFYFYSDKFIAKAAVVLTVLLMIGAGNAENLLVNGDFEQGATGWVQWWGGNSALPTLDPVEGDNCAGVWWYDDGISQDVPISFDVYEFGGDLFTDPGVPLHNRKGVIKVELGDEYGFWYSQQLEITAGDPQGIWQAAKPQAGLPDSMIIDNNMFGAPLARITLMLVNEGGLPDGPVRFDNIYFGPVGVSRQAKFPKPYKNQTVPVSTYELSWTNPAPINELDMISCDVYLEIDDGDLTFTDPPIATGVTSGSVDLIFEGVTLLDDTPYTWRVDCTDPNAGGTPVTTEGAVWPFHVGDQAPVADAGPDQYLWLDSIPKTFTISGTYTDDGKSPILRAEFVQDSHDTWEGTTVIIDNQIWTPGSETVTADVTVDSTGWFGFKLEVEDGIGTGVDSVNVGVYVDACKAAKEDPSDIRARYPAGHGDIDGDCDTDLSDFALFAISWLECMSDKLDCSY